MGAHYARVHTVLKKVQYSKFGELCGEGSCGLNVHNVGVHLVTFVRKWGPVWGWSWSCFPSEDMNADILKTVHGTDVTVSFFA